MNVGPDRAVPAPHLLLTSRLLAGHYPLRVVVAEKLLNFLVGQFVAVEEVVELLRLRNNVIVEVFGVQHVTHPVDANNPVRARWAAHPVLRLTWHFVSRMLRLCPRSPGGRS